ncbi:MAG TPA: helix-turn-helix domain-containing GNAT family N-acetyltransferase [Rhizobiaceae bacterium]|nr:helix-turn-helix domain-containing GNAT family N-acetyltransferase [Rhizobiaceae bacterium]
MEHSAIERVRSFNRAVTLRSGALSGSYLDRGRPLGQARVLFEIGPNGCDVRSLRERLALDSGYLSRVLQALQKQGVVKVRHDPSDRRRREAVLTAKGQVEWKAYDDLSDDLARSILDPLTDRQRARLVDAMATVETLIAAGSVTITTEPPGSDVARQCLDAYFQELAERFENGFDPMQSSAAEDPEMAPPGGAFLIAWLNGRPVGCGGVKTIAPRIGEIKRMWVASDVRGLGLARRLLDAIEAEARRLGMTRVCLDTNRALIEAQTMYRKAGYQDAARYNDNPYAHFWFEKELAPT